MRLFEFITQDREHFVDWLLGDKPAVMLDEKAGLFAGIETSVVVGNDANVDDGEEHAYDAADLGDEYIAELRRVCEMILDAEVDEDGNPIDAA